MRANITQNPLCKIIETCQKNFMIIFPLATNLNSYIPVTSDRLTIESIKNHINQQKANLSPYQIPTNFFDDALENISKLVDTPTTIPDRVKSAFSCYQYATHNNIYKALLYYVALYLNFNKHQPTQSQEGFRTSQPKENTHLGKALLTGNNRNSLPLQQKKSIEVGINFLLDCYNCCCNEIYINADSHRHRNISEKILQPFFDVIRQWPCCKDDATPLSEEEANNDLPYPEQKMPAL